MIEPRSIIDEVAATGSPSSYTPDIGEEGVDWFPGDVAVIMCRGQSTAARTINTASGWSALTQNSHNDGSGYWFSRLFYRRLQTGDGNPTFSHASGGGGQFAYGAIFSEVDVETAEDVGVANGTGTGVTATAPTVTTVTPNAAVLRWFAWFDNPTAIGDPSAGTKLDQHIGATSAHAFSIAIQGTEGASGTVTLAASGGDIGGTDQWHASTLALRPAPSTGEPDPDPEWDYLRQIEYDYEDLPGVEPDDPDLGDGPKAWVPSDLVEDEWIEIRGIDGTVIVGFLPNGVIGFEGDGPYTFEWRRWDSEEEEWGSAQEFTFPAPEINVLLEDDFTGSGTLADREPDGGGFSNWSEARLNSASGDPAGQTLVSGGALTILAADNGGEIDLGQLNHEGHVDWTTGGILNLSVRRANADNYVNANVRLADQDLRLQRRIDGAFSTITTVPGLSFALPVRVGWRVEGAALNLTMGESTVLATEVSTNQESTATKIGAFSGSSGFPGVTRAFAQSINVPETDQILILATDTFEPGATVVCEITPEDETPNAATLNGRAIDIESGADAGGCEIILPSISDLLTGDWTDTPFIYGVPLVLSFATRASISATIRIVPDENYNASGGEDFVYIKTEEQNGGLYEGLDNEDILYLAAEADSIASLGDNGILNILGPGSASGYAFTSGAWTELGDIIQLITNVGDRVMRIGREYTIDYNNHLWGGDGTAVWSAPSGDGLPDGFELDEDTGIATGTISESSAVLLEDIVVRKTVGAVTGDTDPHDFNILASANAIWSRAANPQVIQ